MEPIIPDVLREKNNVVDLLQYYDVVLLSNLMSEYKNYNKFEVEILTTKNDTESINEPQNDIPRKNINFSRYNINQKFFNKYEIQYTIVAALDNDIFRSKTLIEDVTRINEMNLCELNNLADKMNLTTLITNFPKNILYKYIKLPIKRLITSSEWDTQNIENKHHKILKAILNLDLDYYTYFCENQVVIYDDQIFQEFKKSRIKIIDQNNILFYPKKH